jgi:hypothetical protein
MEQADVVRHHEPITRLVPSCTVQRQHREGASADLRADFLQMQVHGVDIGVRQHKPGADASRRAHRAEQIRPFVSLITWRGRSAATLGPDAGQATLLSNPRLVLPPQLDRLTLCASRDRGGDQVGEVFLCASCAAASA